MKLRCRDGDLAVIVGDFHGCEKNIGRIVHVRGPAMFNKQCSMICWDIKPINRRLHYVIEYDGFISKGPVSWKDDVVHPDQWLLPIRPPELSEESALDEYQECTNVRALERHEID